MQVVPLFILFQNKKLKGNIFLIELKCYTYTFDSIPLTPGFECFFRKNCPLQMTGNVFSSCNMAEFTSLFRPQNVPTVLNLLYKMTVSKLCLLT